MSVTKEQLKQEIDSLNEPEFEQIYPLIQQIIEKCKRQKNVSLFDELAEIKLDAPKDFAANFDQDLKILALLKLLAQSQQAVKEGKVVSSAEAFAQLRQRREL